MMLRRQLLKEKRGWRDPYLPKLLHFVTFLQYAVQTGWSRSEPDSFCGDLDIVCNTMTLSWRHHLDKSAVWPFKAQIPRCAKKRHGGVVRRL